MVNNIKATNDILLDESIIFSQTSVTSGAPNDLFSKTQVRKMSQKSFESWLTANSIISFYYFFCSLL